MKNTNEKLVDRMIYWIRSEGRDMLIDANAGSVLARDNYSYMNTK